MKTINYENYKFIIIVAFVFLKKLAFQKTIQFKNSAAANGNR